MNNVLKTFINARLRALDTNVFEAERRGGLKKGFLNDILIDRKESFGAKYYGKVATALESDVSTVARMASSDAGPKASERPRRETTLIPEYDIRAGASFGGGAVAEVENGYDDNGSHIEQPPIRAEWSIPDYYLAATGMRARRTHILAVDGPSMLPDLAPDDRILIDLDDTNPGRDGIFAIWDGHSESVIVKNVQLVRGAERPTIRCISSNKTYEPFDLELGDNTKIIGRVKRRITAV
ncbi:S24 family peptidase [Methylovirgula sp. 4M-Z18]|nr:S24 family peptidase [Methylovirgula sp. 4M-Z18]